MQTLSRALVTATAPIYILIFAAWLPAQTQYSISTFAGQLPPNGVVATQSILGSPQGLVVVGSTLYVGETNGKVIRTIDLGTNIINTVAGNGTTNYSGDGGPATSASFSAP